ncbi:hypothetical protein [Paenibacillus sp. y28]
MQDTHNVLPMFIYLGVCLVTAVFIGWNVYKVAQKNNKGRS